MRLTYFFAIVALAVAELQLTGCGKSSTYTLVEPAKLEKVDGVNKITLTEKAMERMALKTAPVQEGKIEGADNEAPRPFVPYSALMYVPTGETFVYINPKPQTFVREGIDVDYIAGDVAVLKKGPAVGTNVVTVGAAELYGTEVSGGYYSKK